ncbi:GNAT family N-acetyltransferase [Streptomyces sp. NPDC088752]|uniref:GNAT family N-acetyltransferase n=1 Tax=Streptomyces sp. NPDC088752 TaxID=3154963 RepID=UPI003427E8F3
MKALKEVPVAEYWRTAKFFGPDYPNKSFIFSVLSRRIPGQVFSADEAKSSCMVTTNSSYVFLAGKFGPDFVLQALSHLSDRDDVKMIVPPGQILPGSLPGGAELVDRVQYAHRGAPPRAEATIPMGFRLEVLNAELFQRLNWNVATDLFRDFEGFLRGGYGFCLTHAGDVAAEAYSVVGAGISEPGIYTAPGFRGAGLQRILLHELLREAGRRGHQTVLSCDASTHATIALARRFEMTLDVEYQAVRTVQGKRTT